MSDGNRAELKRTLVVDRVWLTMTYRCCGMEWTDEWPEPFKIECPDCGELIEAHIIIEASRRR